MGRGKRLTEVERQIIVALKNEGLSNREVAKRIKRSANVVDNFVRVKENYGIKKSPGRPRALSKRQERAILRVASNSMLSASAIAKEAGVKTNVRNIQRLLKTSPIRSRRKLKKKPPLTSKHVDARLQFAQNHMSWTKEWQNVIFSDEKKFNLDGPDGYSCYYHDLRKEEIILSRRHTGGGSVMVWAAVGYLQKTDLQFLTKSVNAQSYLNILNNILLKYGESLTGGYYIFQHDNATVHTAKVVSSWFKEHGIKVLEWPARSPDLNIMENIWGLLSRRVYQNSRQFSNIIDLKNAIKDAWNKIPQTYIKKLYDGIPTRIFETIRLNGKCTRF